MRKLLLLGVFILILCLAPVFSSAAELYFSEDFEAYSIGSYPTSFTEEEDKPISDAWVFNYGGTYEKVFALDSSVWGKTNNLAYFALVPGERELTLEIDTNIYGAEGDHILGVNDGNIYGYLLFNSVGQVEGSGGVLTNFSEGTWYHVVIVLDIVNSTYDVTFDGSTYTGLVAGPSLLPTDDGPAVGVYNGSNPTPRLNRAFYDNIIVTGIGPVSNPQTGNCFWEWFRSLF